MYEKRVKFSQSLMVWGYMSATGAGKGCFFERSINTSVYQDVLDHFFIPYILNKFGDIEFIFQHDLAPPHTAKSAKKKKKKKKKKFREKRIRF